MDKNSGKILIVDDNPEILTALRYLVEDYFETVIIEKNPKNIPFLIKANKFDVFILDMNFSIGENSGTEGIFWMQQIIKNDPEAIIIFITAFGDIELSVKAIKQGATDFITKPWNSTKLLNTLISAYKLKKSRLVAAKQSKNKEQVNHSGNLPKMILGNAPKMKKVWETIEKVSSTSANVLLIGENGTGKDLIANEIYKLSNRCNQKLIKVDLGSLSESLFESELFGHKKGAFTDAIEDRTGKMEEANGGTLFLDEIGNIPLRMQSKLLTVLQNRMVTKIGSNQPEKIDFRLITATNRNLLQMVKNNEFREDLFYRINTIQIDIPPLRERIDDLPVLFDHFLIHYSDVYNRPVPEVRVKIMEKLKKHSWPGNIRELQHTVEKAVILSSNNKLNLDDFIFPGQKLDMEDNLSIENHEKNLILKAIEKSKGNYSTAAKELGIARKTLYNKILKYGI